MRQPAHQPSPAIAPACLQHKITEFMVGAMDEDLLKHLVEDSINTWWMATEIHKGDLGWGSPNFHKMGRAKVKLIQDFVRWVVGQWCWVHWAVDCRLG